MLKRRDFLHLTVATAAATAVRTSPAARESEYDVIVVGAGSSGCVVAGRLSADAAVRVLLVEAGSPDQADPAILTPGRWVSLVGSEWDWGYQTEPERGLANRRLLFPRGKVVGGSSAINAMTYVRGHARDFDGWRDRGNPGWGFSDVRPYFLRSEDNSRGASEYRGTGGPLAVSDTNDPHAAHGAFLEAAEALGYEASATWEFNGERQENGAGYYQKNIRNGERHSAAAAYLVPALGRPNLTVRSGAQATRLLLEGRRVTGIEYVRNGHIERARTRQEVILCGGVVDSPKLLMLSGIGPAAQLRAHRIPVVVDLPGVGANLQDHLKVSLRWRGRHTLPPSMTTAGLFVKSGRAHASDAPDLQFYVGRGVDQPDPFVTVTFALQRPRSRGDVRLASSDPLTPPLIRQQFLSEQADVDALLAGVTLTRALGEAEPLRRLWSEELLPGPELRTRTQLESFVRETADTIFHPAGTCRMGNDAEAVVDASLRVRGVECLRVADASIMPDVVNATTHAACVMIGERASEMIVRGT